MLLHFLRWNMWCGLQQVHIRCRIMQRREKEEYKFLLCVGLLRLLLCGCLDSGQSVRSSAPALTRCFIGAQPGIKIRAGPWEASRSQTGHICHLSTQNETWLISVTSLWQHRAAKMTDVTPTITGQFFNGCKHRARQKDTQFCVCKWSNYNQEAAPFNQLPWLSSTAFPGVPGSASRQGEQAGPDGPGCCLRLHPHGQRVLLVLCCTQHSSSLFEPHRAQRPACSGGRE